MAAYIKETMKPMTVDKFPSPDYGKIYGRFLLTISLLSMWLNFTLTHPRDSLTTWQSRDIKGMDFQNRTKRSRRGKIGERREEEATKEKLSEQDIIQKVMDGYDWRVRPRGLNASIPDTGGPVIVNVNIMMRSISKVDDVNMEYSVQFTFREQWVDSRLAYKNMVSSGVAMPKFVVLTPNDQSQQVWMPDTFFQNEKEARRHMIDKPNVMIRIYPDGEMLYSVRLSLVLSCPMSLEYYPLDRQTCLIDLANGYTTEDIKYEWKEDGPVQLKDGLKNSLPSFELQDIAPFKEMDESCVQDDICQFDVLQRAFRLSHITADSPYYISSTTNSKIWNGLCRKGQDELTLLLALFSQLDSLLLISSTGEYSCLRTILTLKREYSYYLITLYIPSFMLVVVSWVNFWIDKDAVPARVSLGVTTLLTMTTQASGVNAKLPPVSYTKAIDVWIGVCLAFIFGALLEFALVNYAGRVEFLEKERRKQKVNLLTDNRWLPTVALPFMMQQSSSAANPAGTFMQTRQSTQIPQMQRQMPAADGFSIEAMCPECKAEQSEKKKVHDWERPLTGNSVDHQQRRSSPAPPIINPSHRRSGLSWLHLWFAKYKERSKRIDVISRLVMSILDTISSLLYIVHCNALILALGRGSDTEFASFPLKRA
ncbi:Gamma-aminobutyric acid receptor subunit beta [Trichinella pseudospiralis]|uniref:Gamma-aminobutyric acid receptor subunit beta n=1 Tax=Trichinella pseudospiralis TaxID=6337 RepID=A0A0V1IKI2_TRIPS|nr:Gamma-aminobutyric acid receptor subunit beta [Trichinella pseudospiralis]